MTYSGNDQTEYLDGYRAAMLWANSYDETGESVSDWEAVLDSSGSDIDVSDALDFWNDNAELLEQTGALPVRHGHDFALTRNRHGAGFWDRGYGIAGDLLTDAAHVYGAHNLFVSKDGALSNE